MKKRNFKRFLKEWGWFFAFLGWYPLLAVSVTYLLVGNYVWLKLTLTVICVLYIVAIIVSCEKSEDEYKQQEIEAQNEMLQKVKIEGKYYIDLVDSQVKNTLKELENVNIDIDTSLEYLIDFFMKVNWICKNRIVGKLDSFILASCLMYSLINHPVITINNSDDDEDMKTAIFSINITIAMNCALEIISEPITYFEDNGIWVEEKHPKVNIVIPKGIIKNSELCERIIKSIYCDELDNTRTSIMQFSNLLHLIYLNCQ